MPAPAPAPVPAPAPAPSQHGNESVLPPPPSILRQGDEAGPAPTQQGDSGATPGNGAAGPAGNSQGEESRSELSDPPGENAPGPTLQEDEDVEMDDGPAVRLPLTLARLGSWYLFNFK